MEKVIHKDGASARGDFRRARLRPMVCLACARQGRPKQTMALRAGGSFCGSTVDQHKPDRDLALTAAGIVLLARDPSIVFPHCRILADAYRGAEPDGDPMDHTD